MKKNNSFTPEVALDDVEMLLREINTLRTLKGVKDSQFVVWKDKIRLLMPNILDECGCNSSYMYNIHGLINGTISNKKEYLELLLRVESMLTMCFNKLLPYQKNQQSESISPIQHIKFICSRFESFARVFCSIPHGKCKIVPTLSNEYDMQHVFHSLLALYFDDIRAEEPQPSLASSHTMVDFELKKEHVSIELKYIKSPDDINKIKNQLLIDIPQYSANNTCDIMCIIYDPNRVIQNPVGFKRDIESLPNTKSKVYVEIL